MRYSALEKIHCQTIGKMFCWVAPARAWLRHLSFVEPMLSTAEASGIESVKFPPKTWFGSASSELAAQRCTDLNVYFECLLGATIARHLCVSLPAQLLMIQILILLALFCWHRFEHFRTRYNVVARAMGSKFQSPF